MFLFEEFTVWNLAEFRVDTGPYLKNVDITL